MRHPILLQTANIPKSLYVQRQADIQLRTNISGMGRPAYILVARQMGKTNMLQHLKMECENEQNLYPYIDLSNKFDTPSEYFRNIIDTALDICPNSVRIQTTRQKIIESRNKGDVTSAFKEHERELRWLLQSLDGKLVIILDEIDALTNYNFADDIFAQIRSVYFSRINIKEFERLTYVLSGVAEPSELIKNKNLSPFNIGEKILLFDFTRPEFDQFLRQSSLNLSNEIADRIFYWTGGHPRMTWDTCAELEKVLINKNQIEINEIDEVITGLYLDRNDMPPIDHIRSLVEADPDVRDALIEIHNGKSSILSSAVRNKLYLAGIIKAGIRPGEPVEIKNQVIAHCLSAQELESIGFDSNNLIQAATLKVMKGELPEAIAAFEKAKSQESGQSLVVYRPLGTLYLLAGRYREAVEHLTAYIPNRQAVAILYSEHYLLLGLAYLSMNEGTNAYQALKLSRESAPDGYVIPAVVIGVTSFRLRALNVKIEEEEEKTKSLCLSIIQDSNQIAFSNLLSKADNLLTNEAIEMAAVLFLLRYSQGEVFSAAEQKLDKICFENEVENLNLLTAACLSNSNLERALSYLRRIIAILASRKCKLDSGFHSTLLPFGEHELMHFLPHALLRFPGLGLEVISACVESNLVTMWKDPFSVLLSIFNQSLKYSKMKNVEWSNLEWVKVFFIEIISKYAMNHAYASIDFSDLYRLGMAEVKENGWLIDEYIKYRTNAKPITPLGWTDVSLIYQSTWKMMEQGNASAVPDIIRRVSAVQKVENTETRVQAATLDYVEMESYCSRSDWKQASRKAKGILAALPMGMTLQFTHSHAPNPTILQRMREKAYQVATGHTSGSTVIQKPKYRPNDKVTVRYIGTGLCLERKYKYVKDDLESGLCVIA